MATCRPSAPAARLLHRLQTSGPNVSRSFLRWLTTETTRSTPASAHADVQSSSLSTEAALGSDVSRTVSTLGDNPLQYQPPANPFITAATCTTYSFPSMEPTDFVSYPSTHLLLPLRKDLLHRAVIYEADASKQGTANTKWRSEVHGSNRKIRPQKGTGSARLGDKKSPMLRGGGVAFGPKPRSFATELPKKIYDLAFRTALSHRYRQGELLLTNGTAELDVDPDSAARYLRDMLRHNGMGHTAGRTIFVTLERRTGLFSALEDMNMTREGKAKTVLDVDVKNLLEMGRIVMERDALEWLLQKHEDDLPPISKLERWTDAHGQQLCKKKLSKKLSVLLSK